MPLPSFNMEDILNPNFQTFPAITSGYRAIPYANSPKQRIFHALNYYHSSAKFTDNATGQSYDGRVRSASPSPDRLTGEVEKLDTCVYSVIRRTLVADDEKSDLLDDHDKRRSHFRNRKSSYSFPKNVTAYSEVVAESHTDVNVIKRCNDKGASVKHGTSPTGRRLRTVFNDRQLAALEDRFTCQKYLSTPDRDCISKSLGLTPMQVKTWYQNRRMRWKKAVLTGECPDELAESLRKRKGRPKESSYAKLEMSRVGVIKSSKSRQSPDRIMVDQPVNLALPANPFPPSDSELLL